MNTTPALAVFGKAPEMEQIIAKSGTIIIHGISENQKPVVFDSARHRVYVSHFELHDGNLRLTPQSTFHCCNQSMRLDRINCVESVDGANVSGAYAQYAADGRLPEQQANVIIAFLHSKLQ